MQRSSEVPGCSDRFQITRRGVRNPLLNDPIKLMEQSNEPLIHRRLVKAVYIYSNGDTVERSWSASGQKQRPVSIVATHENGSVREYAGHYQVFLRIEKPTQGGGMSKDRIFSQAVNILTRMLVLKKRNVN